MTANRPSLEPWKPTWWGGQRPWAVARTTGQYSQYHTGRNRRVLTFRTEEAAAARATTLNGEAG